MTDQKICTLQTYKSIILYYKEHYNFSTEEELKSIRNALFSYEFDFFNLWKTIPSGDYSLIDEVDIEDKYSFLEDLFLVKEFCIYNSSDIVDKVKLDFDIDEDEYDVIYNSIVQNISILILSYVLDKKEYLKRFKKISYKLKYEYFVEDNEKDELIGIIFDIYKVLIYLLTDTNHRQCYNILKKRNSSNIELKFYKRYYLTLNLLYDKIKKDGDVEEEGEKLKLLFNTYESFDDDKMLLTVPYIFLLMEYLNNKINNKE